LQYIFLIIIMCINFIRKFMNKRTAILLILPFFFAITSCIRNDLDAFTDLTIEDVAVPGDFDWSTVVTAKLTVTPEDVYNAQYHYIIEVFGENPVTNSSASLLAKGVATRSMSFVTSLVMPASTSIVYVRQTTPTKNQVVQAVAVSGSSDLTCDFNTTVSVKASAMAEIPSLRSAKNVIAQDPTPSGATQLTSKSDNVDWTSNANFVIPAGETYSGSVVLGNNSALYVEGIFKLAGNKNFTMNSGSKLVIQSSGDFQTSSKSDFQFDTNTQVKNFGNIKSTNNWTITNNALFYNYGTFDVVKFSATNTAEIHNSGTFTSNNSVELTSSAKLYNNGIIDIKNFSTTNAQCTVVNSGDFDVQDVSIASAPFTNEGSLVVGKTLALSSSCNLYNTGSIVTKDMTTGSGAKIYNNCHLLVTDDFNAKGVSVFLYNQSLLKTTALISDGSIYQMEGGAILEAETAKFSTWRNYINGSNSGYALARLKTIEPVKASDLSSNITFQGDVEIECTSCTANPQYNTFYVVSGSDVRWSLTGASTTVIAASSCNGTGNAGVVTPEEPVTPTDPAFPILVDLTTDYSFVMEDSWPNLGDYDLNDLVVDLNISYLQNAENKATKMMVTYKLRAVGATKRIAAAFQLDKILSGQVSSVSYSTPVLTGEVFTTEKGGLEAGQTNAVIPMFDEAHAFLTPNSSNILNTIIGGEYYEPKTNTVTITFDSPVDPSNISIPNLNFFIVTDGYATVSKRTEVHLYGFEPTDKADLTLFDTGDDASGENGNYRSTKNLIWGLLIPVSFDYASEWRDVTSAYPEFAGWCKSGGTGNNYWYQNPSNKSGYIFTTK